MMEPARRVEENRIEVHTCNGVTSIRYMGSDPDTRYMPREPSVWRKIRESFRMG